jgi:hypothetical protein
MSEAVHVKCYGQVSDLEETTSIFEAIAIPQVIPHILCNCK